MTLSLLTALWVLAVPAVLGVTALAAAGLRWADDRLGYLAWCWPLGCLALGGGLFVFLVLGIEPGLWWLAPPFLLLLLALLAVRRKRANGGAAAAGAVDVGAVEHRRPGEWLFVAVVIAGVAWSLLHMLAGDSRPCVEADEGNLWSLKAKSLLFDWYAGQFAQAQVFNVHPDYPLLNPLLQAWVSSQHGAIVQFENRWLVQLCSLSLWLAVASAVRVRLPGAPGALLLLLMPFAPDFEHGCRHAYADGMVALGLTLMLDGWLRWRASGSTPWLSLSALGAAFALWSKNEASMYVAVALGLQCAAAWRRRRHGGRVGWSVAACWLLPAVVLGGQLLWNRHFGFRSDLFGANPTGKSLPELIVLQTAERLPELLQRMAQLLFGVEQPHGLFVVLLLSPLLWPRLAFGQRLWLPTCALIASLLAMHAVYLGSWLPLQFHLDTSYERVTFQLLPACMVWFAVLARQWLDERAAGPAAAPS